MYETALPPDLFDPRSTDPVIQKRFDAINAAVAETDVRRLDMNVYLQAIGYDETEE